MESEKLMYYENNDVRAAWMEDLQAFWSKRTMILAIACGYHAEERSLT
jgi:hypothetical protein